MCCGGVSILSALSDGSVCFDRQAAPVMRPFNPDEFCQRLADSGPQLTTGIKGDWVGTVGTMAKYQMAESDTFVLGCVS